MDKKRKYLAHISKDKKREQTILEHLEGTAELAGDFAEEFGFRDWGYCCGMLHDIGKYTDKFQERLHGSSIKVDHATAGAKVCNEKGGYYSFLGYCIAGHHAGLPDTGGSMDEADSRSYTWRMNKKLEDYSDYRQEVRVPELKTVLFPEGNPKSLGFTLSFFVRMLYSCLVDADYLDTEQFMSDGGSHRIAGEEIPKLWDKLHRYIAGWLENTETDTINGRRTEILKHCIEMGLKSPGVFNMTVPTGGGKTVASLAFALRHAAAHGMKRVIYVIPYTSIIEQNAQVFRDILGGNNILEHHSGVEYESDEELHPMQLAAENWDMPVVVTTNVQFFESLFSNKSSKCRKLHSIANSVIIFDEAQMLPNDYLKPCVAAMEELVTHYKSSVVLCTATQPALSNFFSKNMAITELCPRVEEQFQFFQRTSIQKLGKISREDLVERLKKETQALCILNTKQEVQKIFEQLQGEGVYHLSTLMYSVHRKQRLKEIRKHMKEGKRCIVISTSLVEAGVDLDFQTVYRQLAGVDSVIQAAGRCNREGRRNLKESVTYVFQLEEAQKVPGQEQQIDTARKILRDYGDISSLEAIEEYFKCLYSFREGALGEPIMRKFEEGGFVFAEIADEFKVIKETTRTIFVPKEERAKEILGELQRKGATRQLIREASQYSVNVYENVFKRIFDAGMLMSVSEDLKEEFFVLRNCKDYSEETGLKINVELGEGIWC